MIIFVKKHMSYSCLFYFIAKDNSIEFDLSAPQDDQLNWAKSKILQPFVAIQEDGSANLECFQKNSKKIQDGVEALVNELGSSIPKLFQLRSFFTKSLAIDELFYVNCSDDMSGLSLGERSWILSILENPEDMNKAESQYQALCDMMAPFEDKFDLKVFCKDTKDSIGEKDKTKRVCRYCHRDSSEVSFRKIAHTISEALENKAIITNDECDACNQRFGDTIETDFLRLVDFQRMFYGMRGKGGVLKKFEGSNYTLTKDVSPGFTAKVVTDKPSSGAEIPSKIVLEIQNPFPVENVYKALCKYSFGVMSAELLPHFETLRAWLVGEIDIPILPPVAVRQMEEKIDHPFIMMYERVDNSLLSMPHVFCEVRIIDTAYVLIIPGSDMDSTDFSIDDNYRVFWDYLTMYNKVPGWRFKNFSGKNLIKEKIINIISGEEHVKD